MDTVLDDMNTVLKFLQDFDNVQSGLDLPLLTGKMNTVLKFLQDFNDVEHVTSFIKSIHSDKKSLLKYQNTLKGLKYSQRIKRITCGIA